ncbi:High mobility group box 1 [Coemansia javaensis]|uniref:High mobility group box 1 n=1 Tax=Coemansia javaensis TaxID=2761396 RepID=A0A9W8HDC6_9FUNG|nr:High mobility group box 1 [Coemansia javaensis]
MGPAPPTDFALGPEDAHQLAEGYYRLAVVYSRIAGIPLNPKLIKAARVRDPKRPKRPPTAYLLFSSDKRASVNTEFPGLRSQDVAIKIGEAWRALDPETRNRYTRIANKLRDDYFVKVDAYKKRSAALDDDDEDDDDEDYGGEDEADDLVGSLGSQPSSKPAKRPASQPAAPAAAAPAAAPAAAAAPAPEANGHVKHTKKRRAHGSGSEKPHKSKHSATAPDAGAGEAPKKKKKKKSKTAAAPAQQ